MNDSRTRALNWQLLAEQRIQDAMAAGAFENLPCIGQPIPGIDEPLDEFWCIKQKLRRERVSLSPQDVQDFLRGR